MIHFLIVFSVFSAWGQDLGFRWSEEKSRCEKEGQFGLNPNYIGQCGDLRDTRISTLQISSQDLTGAWLNDHSFEGQAIEGAIFRSGLLKRLNIKNTVFRRCNFAMASLSSSRAEGADFSGSHMDQVSYWFARADGASFNAISGVQGVFYGYFRKADFSQAYLPYADFVLSDLTGANFEGADLRSVRFQNAWLNGAKMKGSLLTGAYYDVCTKLPFSENEARSRGMIKTDRGGTPCHPQPF